MSTNSEACKKKRRHSSEPSPDLALSSIKPLQKIYFVIDELEQHSHKSCIQISGVPHTQDEDTTKLVCDVATKVNVNLDPSDISVSHRVPTKKGPKQIIAHFTRAKKRAELLRASQNIKVVDELKGVNISQDLTKLRAKLAYLARNTVRSGKINKISVQDRKIFITDKKDNKKHVTNEAEFQAIFSDSTNENMFPSVNLPENIVNKVVFTTDG